MGINIEETNKGEDIMTIKVSETAPEFTLKDQEKNDIKLSDLKGKKVILSWHPLAFTSVCTDQMRSLESPITTVSPFSWILS